MPQVGQDFALNSGFERSAFFSYGDTSALELTSLAGNVRFRNQVRNAEASRFFGVSSVSQSYFPGNVEATAFSGDITLAGRMDIYPAARGSLNLLAGNSVVLDAQQLVVTQSGGDASVGPIPSAAIPPVFSTRPPTPVHQGDPLPNLIVADTGSVTTRSVQQTGSFTLAKRTVVHAGIDIADVSFGIQHNNPGDASVLQAIRNIDQAPQRRPNGQFDSSDNRVFSITGPGRVDFIAGGRIELGASSGILTSGNLNNPTLPAGGADVNIYAGVGAGPDIAGFIDWFAEQDLEDFVAGDLADLLGIPDSAGAEVFLAALRAADPLTQREVVKQLFFSELLAGGLTGTDNGDYSQAFDAIDELFPDEKGEAGDLSLLLSQIRTQAGGNIDLLVPGGLVNGGVASAESLVKPADQLGIVVTREGSVRAYVHEDFIVNQSRVFVLDGGDIMLWSSVGDVDAGKGAKTALSIPPPQIVLDSQGNTRVVVSSAVSGSGIRAFVATPGRPPGNVYLFAPQGVVNAGDAGIGSAGNITIGATEVIGADNINVGGIATGVPAAPVAIAAGLTGVSGASTSATRAAQDSASDSLEEDDEDLSDALSAGGVSLIEVEVLGFGS
jgi:hypothetical protein